jgi:hypothetical protein
MHDAADDTPIVRSLDTAHIRRQMRLDPLPLLIAQPKKAPAHDPDPPKKPNHARMESELSCLSSKIIEF